MILPVLITFDTLGLPNGLGGSSTASIRLVGAVDPSIMSEKSSI